MRVGLRLVRLLPGTSPGELEEAQPVQPSPFPLSQKPVPAGFPHPRTVTQRGSLPPLLWVKGGFSALGKARKAFLAAHNHFHPLFPLLRPPQTSPRPLLEYVPFFLGGGGSCKEKRRREVAAFSSSSQLDIWIIFPPFLVSALPNKQNSSGHSWQMENQWKPAEHGGETGEARLEGGGGGAGGWSLRAGGFPEEARREPGRGCRGRGGRDGLWAHCARGWQPWQATRRKRSPDGRVARREVPLPSGGKERAQVNLCP